MACYNNHQCTKCPHPCSSEVQEKEHQKWYSSLPVKDKVLVTETDYPACTVVWNNWSRDEREAAIEKSGFIRGKRIKGPVLGHDF